MAIFRGIWSTDLVPSIRDIGVNKFSFAFISKEALIELFLMVLGLLWGIV